MSGACAIDGCSSRVSARGWCAPHYNQWYRRNRESIAPRPSLAEEELACGASRMLTALALPGWPVHPSLGIAGVVVLAALYLGVFISSWRLVQTVWPVVVGWWRGRPAARARAEVERCGRVLLFVPREMPPGWEPNPRDPSPKPRRAS